MIFWLDFYDNVYSMPDKPSDDIIENDILLDDWWDKKIKEYQSKHDEVIKHISKGHRRNPKFSSTGNVSGRKPITSKSFTFERK